MYQNIELTAQKIILDILEGFNIIDEDSMHLAKYIAMDKVNEMIEQYRPKSDGFDSENYETYSFDPQNYKFYYFLIELFAFIEKSTPPMYFRPTKKAGVSSFFNN